MIALLFYRYFAVRMCSHHYFRDNLFLPLPPRKTLGKRSHDDVRRHKIRIVERLGSVKSVLAEESDIRSPVAKSRTTSFEAVEW